MRKGHKMSPQKKGLARNSDSAKKIWQTNFGDTYLLFYAQFQFCVCGYTLGKMGVVVKDQGL